MIDTYKTPKRLKTWAIGDLVDVVGDSPSGEKTFFTVWELGRMGWQLSFDKDLICVHIAEGTFYERKEVYKKIKTNDYYKHNRIFCYQNQLYACIKSNLIGPGR